mgnify:CR=1 FL=1
MSFSYSEWLLPMPVVCEYRQMDHFLVFLTMPVLPPPLLTHHMYGYQLHLIAVLLLFRYLVIETTRAAIFKGDKILLVHEKNGTWSMPGGWVDVLESVASNTIKEVREEAGLKVELERIIAIQDRNKHNVPVYAYGVCKIFSTPARISVKLYFPVFILIGFKTHRNLLLITFFLC